MTVTDANNLDMLDRRKLLLLHFLFSLRRIPIYQPAFYALNALRQNIEYYAFTQNCIAEIRTHITMLSKSSFDKKLFFFYSVKCWRELCMFRSHYVRIDCIVFIISISRLSRLSNINLICPKMKICSKYNCSFLFYRKSKLINNEWINYLIN